MVEEPGKSALPQADQFPSVRLFLMCEVFCCGAAACTTEVHSEEADRLSDLLKDIKVKCVLMSWTPGLLIQRICQRVLE